jgi:hypothetical protein
MSTAPNVDNGKVWICAHGRMDIENARNFHTRFLNHPEGSFVPCNDEGCAENVHTTLTSCSLEKQMHCTLESRIRLFEAVEYDATILLSTTIKQYFTKSRLAQLPPHLRVPVCAHINLKDADVAKHFSPSAIWNAKGKIPLMQYLRHARRFPRAMRQCAKCRGKDAVTLYAFTTRVFVYEDYRVLRLSVEIFRDLGTLQSATASMWKCYELDAKQGREIRARWLGWKAFSMETASYWADEPEPAKKSVIFKEHVQAAVKKVKRLFCFKKRSGERQDEVVDEKDRPVERCPNSPRSPAAFMKVGVAKIKSRLRSDSRRTENIMRDDDNDVEEKLFLIEKTPTHEPNTVGVMRCKSRD